MTNFIRRFLNSQSLAVIYAKVALTLITVLFVLWACASLILLYSAHGIENTVREFVAEVRATDYEHFSKKHLFTFGETGKQEYQLWKKQLQYEYSLSIEQMPGSGHVFFHFENGDRAAVVVDVDYLPPGFRISSVAD